MHGRFLIIGGTCPVAETWRRVWGDGKIFRGSSFLNDVFSEKISIFTAKNSDDLYLVIDQIFLIFPYFFQIFHIFTVLNVVYDPLLTRKTTISEINSLMRPFFDSVRAFARIRQHYFSKYWGDGYMDRPPPHIFGGPSPQSPIGLRPCTCPGCPQSLRLILCSPFILVHTVPCHCNVIVIEHSHSATQRFSGAHCLVTMTRIKHMLCSSILQLEIIMCVPILCA